MLKYYLSKRLKACAIKYTYTGNKCISVPKVQVKVNYTYIDYICILYARDQTKIGLDDYWIRYSLQNVMEWKY